MYIVILLNPLIGGILGLLWGNKLGVRWVSSVIKWLLVTDVLIIIVAYYEVGINNSAVILKWYVWVFTVDNIWELGLLYDSLTVSLLLPILVVSLLVIYYSQEYMSNDSGVVRFESYMSLFVFFIMLLITADNYIILFIGWEIIGVVSYLLISYYNNRVQGVKGGINAFLYNRVGDIFLTISLWWILWELNSTDISLINSSSNMWSGDWLGWILLLMLLGGIGKSAQIPYHIWLPYSIEGPTPVSALLHSSTLVTAGIYVLLRSSMLLESASNVILWIIVGGSLTALLTGVLGLFIYDMKRIIAFSTTSQLGYIIVIIGIGNPILSLYHLVNHAYIKSILFLTSGNVIHGIRDEQDIRRLGGLSSMLPYSNIVFLLGSLSLIALPYLTGYYSKDYILEYLLTTNNENVNKMWSYVIFVILLMGAVMTALYSGRLIYYTFYSNPIGSKERYREVHEPGRQISVSVLLLGVLSLVGGYIFVDNYIGQGSTYLNNTVISSNYNLVEIELELLWYKWLPGVLSVGSLCLIIIILKRSKMWWGLLMKWRGLYSLLVNKYYLDMLLTLKVVNSNLSLGESSILYLDKGIIEWLGPLGLRKWLSEWIWYPSRINTGIVIQYGLVILSTIGVGVWLIMNTKMWLGLWLSLGLLMIP